MRVLDPDGAAVAGERLPDAARRHAQAVGTAWHRLGPVDRRDRPEMMAEVAGGGEIGRPAILVAAVAGDRRHRRESLGEARAILRVERKAEDFEVVGTMLALAQAGADDRRRDGVVFEHPAGRDVGDRDAVPVGDLPGRAEQALEGRPAAGDVDEALVLAAAPVRRRRRLLLAEPAVGQEAAAERAIDQQLHALLFAQRREVAGRPTVDERERDLVGERVECRRRARRADAPRRNW